MRGNKNNLWSFVSVVVLALLLPGILRLTNKAQRFLVGAEGRLAAIGVETDKAIGPMPRPWAALAQGGDQLTTFLDGNTEKVKSLGTEYVRIDHIYTQFEVVKRNSENGQLLFDFSSLDSLVSKITQSGAKPFFSLSYMPPALASLDITSEPKDWEEWSLLVQKTIERYSGKDGIDDVYYEVWNEPDLFGQWKMGGKKDYKTLYAYSARGASRAKTTRSYKFGGPATTGLYKNWVDNFFPFIRQNQYRLDFFSWHRYDLDLDKYIEDVESIDRWIESHPYFAKVEKIVSEKGPESTAGGNNDTFLGAAHLIAVGRELMYKTKYGFSFAVSGQWGIIGKPREQALKLLSRLGDQRLSVTGEGTNVRAIGAKNGETYQVLVVNYDKKSSHFETVPITFLNLKESNFVLERMSMDGQVSSERVSTSEAVLQFKVPLKANSATLLELRPVAITKL